jgi:hypothetical protein
MLSWIMTPFFYISKGIRVYIKFDFMTYKIKNNRKKNKIFDFIYAHVILIHMRFSIHFSIVILVIIIIIFSHFSLNFNSKKIHLKLIFKENRK